MLEMRALCALRLVCRTLKDRIAKTPVRCSTGFAARDLPRLFTVLAKPDQIACLTNAFSSFL